jgi:nucleoid DNA-binding protein
MGSKIQKKNKSDLKKLFLRSEKDLEKNVNEHIFESFFSTLNQFIKNKKDIELRNFGSFKIKKMSSRIGRNPQNQKKIYIPEKFKLTFKLSKNLLKKINE